MFLKIFMLALLVIGVPAWAKNKKNTKRAPASWADVSEINAKGFYVINGESPSVAEASVKGKLVAGGFEGTKIQNDLDLVVTLKLSSSVTILEKATKKKVSSLALNVTSELRKLSPEEQKPVPGFGDAKFLYEGVRVGTRLRWFSNPLFTELTNGKYRTEKKAYQWEESPDVELSFVTPLLWRQDVSDAMNVIPPSAGKQYEHVVDIEGYPRLIIYKFRIEDGKLVEETSEIARK